MDRPISQPIALNPVEFAEVAAYAQAVFHGKIPDERSVSSCDDSSETMEQFDAAAARAFQDRPEHQDAFLLRFKSMMRTVMFEGGDPEFLYDEGGFKPHILWAAAVTPMTQVAPGVFLFGQELFEAARRIEAAGQ